MIDDQTVAIDFYDPTMLNQGINIEYTQEFFEDYLIDDMTYSYGTYDYRNKQVMTSNEVMANITSSESIIANGYQTQYNTEQKIRPEEIFGSFNFRLLHQILGLCSEL